MCKDIGWLIAKLTERQKLIALIATGLTASVEQNINPIYLYVGQY